MRQDRWALQPYSRSHPAGSGLHFTADEHMQEIFHIFQ